MSSVRTVSMAIALAFAGTGIAAHAGVVVKSSGPSASQYPPGKKLPDGTQITLRDGDSVTILTSTTGTQVLSGAGNHRVGKRGVSRRSTFATLTKERASRRGRLGTSRSGGGATDATVRSPNLWYVDVTQSGTVCVANPAAVRLWRPGTVGDSTYVVASSSSADHVHVAFEDGYMDTGWDLDRLPLSDGMTYLITGPDGASSSEITFAMLDAAGDEAEGLAEQLIEKGCTQQLDLLTLAMS